MYVCDKKWSRCDLVNGLLTYYMRVRDSDISHKTKYEKDISLVTSSQQISDKKKSDTK